MPSLKGPPSAVRTALVNDALDRIGLRSQALGPDIRPLNCAGVTVGRALPVRAAPSNTGGGAPYEGLLATLDAIRPGEVLVVACSRSDVAAVWGELCHTACQAAGGLGVVTDGLIRDTAALDATGAAVYSRGTRPCDIADRLLFGAPGADVEIDGVLIAPHDIVVADEDGVVIVPADVAEEVLSSAAAKATQESEFRDAVKRGMAPSEAFERFGVL
jgi:4-hydroxy-4-methyl-2-oxoglutarate aldolase